jgi:D-beta-D-heptose 7-phosphate kinase/D-beta-D-heptose 1-phosphate adenosyltransferase
VSFRGHSLYPHVVIGLNSDESVKRLKGDSRPINSQEDRAYVLKSLEYVDEVIIFDEDTPYELIKSVKPDFIVKGGDYKKEDVVGNDLAEVLIYNYIDGYSTTNIIKKSQDDL